MESFASIASTILDAVDNLVAFRWPTIDEMPLLRFHNRLERNQAEQENNLALSEIADALSVVSNAKAKITALYDVLHHRQALLQQRSAPISALPNELLGDIFCLVSKHSQSSSSPWNLPRRGWVTSLWLSHVCQQWRSVAQANSPLWANLNVQTRRQGNLIPLFAQYSRLSRLRLLISGISARREDTGPMISLISAQARQISDLRISGYWIPGLLGYPEVMFDLESLTLQDSIVPSKDLEQFSATRHLRLEKAMVFRNGSHVLSMPNLTELVYENQSLAYIQMGIVLLDAPNLSRIQIIEEEPVGDDSDDGGPYQSDKILPSLRSLSIRNNLTVLWSLFPTIFENLCLGIRDLDLSVPLGFGGMPHILDGPRTGADLNRLLSSMPSLESLTLSIHRENLLQTLSRAFGSLSDPSEGIIVPQLRTLRIDLSRNDAGTIAPQGLSRMATEIARCLGPRLLESVHHDLSAEGPYMTGFGTSARAITTLTLPRSLVGQTGEASEEWYRSRVPNFTVIGF